ncbi:MAG: zinc ribbon domain-containing protein [Oscillospiraceae bacterium]|nr:zinc ribbon domain-containing protein [Oscillospiraceae bacterium]
MKKERAWCILETDGRAFCRMKTVERVTDMEFDLSKLQEAAADLAQKAVQGVNYVAQKGKETYDRLSLENELNKAQRQLGSYYYNQVRMGADHGSAMAECIANIDSIMDALSELDGAAAAVQEKGDACPVCGAEPTPDAMFCPKCGTKL